MLWLLLHFKSPWFTYLIYGTAFIKKDEKCIGASARLKLRRRWKKKDLSNIVALKTGKKVHDTSKSILALLSHSVNNPNDVEWVRKLWQIHVISHIN